MRWHVATLVAIALLAPGVRADSASVRGDLDYELDATVHGRIAAGLETVLTSTAVDGKAPSPASFHLRAASLEATFYRSYVVQKVVAGSPRLLVPAESSAIRTSGESTEKRAYSGADLTLFETSPLWDIVAVAPTNGTVHVALPTSDYTLANADPSTPLMRSDVPVPRAFARDLENPRAVVRDALRVSSPQMGATLRGDFILVLYGGTFDLTATGAAERFVTGRYDDIERGEDIPVPEPRSVNATAFLRVKQGVLTLGAGDDLVALHARTLHVQGLLEFRRVSGTLDVAGESTTTIPRTLEGDFDVSSRGAPYQDAQGDRFGAMRVEGTTLVPTRASAAPILALAAVAGASVAALAAAVRWIPGPQRLFFVALAGFSMVKKEEALGMKSRGQLYDYVRANPGANLSDVQRVLGLGWGTTLYHVSVLERLSMVVTKRVGGRRLIFVNGASRLVDPAAWSAMQNPAVRRLAAELLIPGRRLTQAEVARVLDFSPQYAGRLLHRLEGVGLVARSTDAMVRVYEASPLMGSLAQRAAIVPAPLAGPTPMAAALNA